MCGALHFIGERKWHSSLPNPKFSGCCSNGLITAEIGPRFANIPIVLKRNLTENNSKGRAYQRNIRNYNSALAMASGTSNCISPSIGTSAFNPTLTMQGQLHHFIGLLNPSEGPRSRYLSVYIHDSFQNEVERANERQEDFPSVSASVLTNLEEMLQDCNSLVQSFLSQREITQGDETPQTIRLVIQANRPPSNEHERRYNAPVAYEVAGIVIGSDADHIHRNDILNDNGNETMQRISASHRNYDALCYPLLFPDGQDGWYIGLQCTKPGSNNQKKASPMMDYQPFLLKRKNCFPLILLSGRLFQMFLVDMYVKIESEKNILSSE